jgi:hypothetical protein
LICSLGTRAAGQNCFPINGIDARARRSTG